MSGQADQITVGFKGISIAPNSTEKYCLSLNSKVALTVDNCSISGTWCAIYALGPNANQARGDYGAQDSAITVTNSVISCVSRGVSTNDFGAFVTHAKNVSYNIMNTSVTLTMTANNHQLSVFYAGELGNGVKGNNGSMVFGEGCTLTVNKGDYTGTK